MRRVIIGFFELFQLLSVIFCMLIGSNWGENNHELFSVMDSYTASPLGGCLIGAVIGLFVGSLLAGFGILLVSINAHLEEIKVMLVKK